MTMHPFRRRQDISHGDALDEWLNTRTSGSGTTPNEPEGENLTGAAQEFHAWADNAQERDPAATGPADDLWNRILSDSGRLHADPVQTEWSDGDMDTTIQPPMVERVPPQSNRTKRVQQEAQSSRAGGWLNAVAAALLLLSLGGGAYLASNGGFGFGGDGDEGRYAAQVVSPEASSAGGDAVCDVEPLTTDQIVAYVENPYSYMPDDVFGTPAPGNFSQTLPSIDLIEAVDVQMAPSTGQGEVPDDATFEDVRSVARQYLACMYNGTAAQILTFLRPQEIQDIVFQNLPVYRTEEDVRDFVESVRDMRFGDLNPWLRPVGASVALGEQRIFVNPESTDARVFQARRFEGLEDSDKLAFIGLEYHDEAGEVIGLTGWDGTPLVGGHEQTNGGGSLVFVHSESTDTWYFFRHNSPWG